MSSVFAQALDATLRDRKISAKDLAPKAGITPEFLSQFRRGKQTMTVEKLTSLLEHLDPDARIYFWMKCLQAEGDTSLADLFSQADSTAVADAMVVLAERVRSLNSSASPVRKATSNCSSDLVGVG